MSNITFVISTGPVSVLLTKILVAVQQLTSDPSSVIVVAPGYALAQTRSEFSSLNFPVRVISPRTFVKTELSGKVVVVLQDAISPNTATQIAQKVIAAKHGEASHVVWGCHDSAILLRDYRGVIGKLVSNTPSLTPELVS